MIAAELPGPEAKAEIDSFAEQLRSEPGIAFVSPPRINEEGNAAIVTVIPRGSPQDEETQDLVTRLREDVVPDALGTSGITAEIGGVTAALEDQSEYIKDRMPLFIAGVIGLSFLLLLVAFRSPLISLKAGVMNLLSVSAAYGVMTLFAKGGTLGGLIGIDHEVPIAPFMPVMMFAILFGLSMDYEVFLMTHIKEAWERTRDNRLAVIYGVAHTGRVITSAALIMVSVFFAFVINGDPTVKQFGVGMGVAVAVDATIVRCLLVPAVMTLLGRSNWWFPAWLDRIVPNFSIEGDEWFRERDAAAQEERELVAR